MSKPWSFRRGGSSEVQPGWVTLQVAVTCRSLEESERVQRELDMTLDHLRLVIEDENAIDAQRGSAVTSWASA